MNCFVYILNATKQNKAFRRFAVLTAVWAFRTEKKMKSMKNKIDILTKEVESLKVSREE